MQDATTWSMEFLFQLDQLIRQASGNEVQQASIPGVRGCTFEIFEGGTNVFGWRIALPDRPNREATGTFRTHRLAQDDVRRELEDIRQNYLTEEIPPPANYWKADPK
jgi:hypothetical protein